MGFENMAWKGMPVPPRTLTQPVEGTYATRLVKHGPWVPVKLERLDGRWLATINGQPLTYRYTEAEIETEAMVSLLQGQLSRHPFVKLLAYARVIPSAKYQSMLVRLALSAPDDPRSNPKQAVDLSKRPSLW
jgi:hypothetical protein